MRTGPFTGIVLFLAVIAGLCLLLPKPGLAMGVGVKGGLGLLQKEDLTYGGTTSGQTLWMAGAFLDLPVGRASRLSLAPGFDYSSRAETRMISFGIEARYQLYQGPRSTIYAGLGPGINIKRITGTPGARRTVKGSLNVPIGAEFRVGKGRVRWIVEMKMAIADDQVDSAYRFGTGLLFTLK